MLVFGPNKVCSNIFQLARFFCSFQGHILHNPLFLFTDWKGGGGFDCNRGDTFSNFLQILQYSQFFPAVFAKIAVLVGALSTSFLHIFTASTNCGAEI